MKLAIPDLISPSYFPAIAAVELGCLERRGISAELVLRFPVTDALNAVRRGELDYLAGAAHALFHAAPDGGGVQLMMAISHRTYWYLVIGSDLGIQPGSDLSALVGLRIGAAAGPADALVQMLAAAGVDPSQVAIGPVPGTEGAGVSFGVTAARALADGKIDGFWANGMGAEVAVRQGIGTVVVDARRGGGPPGTAGYTFAALMTSAATARDRPEELEAVVEGVMDAQRQLRRDPQSARSVAEKLFPPMEADLTPGLVARDAPFYDPTISDDMLEDLVAFARRCQMTEQTQESLGLLAPGVRQMWRAHPDREAQ